MGKAKTVEVSIEVIEDAIAALVSAGCQFWACKGPTLNPIPMITCNACAAVGVLSAAIDKEVPQ